MLLTTGLMIILKHGTVPLCVC